jgi:hypothetical protein
LEVRLKQGKEASTLAALEQLSSIAREEVALIFDVLESAVSLKEAKAALLGDMLLEGNTFSVSIRENFQFIVAGLLGESDNDEILLVEVMLYE